MDFASKKCIPCEAGVKPFSLEKAEEYIKELGHGWILEDKGAISKKVHLRSFLEAIAFVNEVAKLAESEGHHPDMNISYDTVVFRLSTHSIKGLSENDFILASKIEKLIHPENV